jgi:hypothetical protein
LRNPRIAHQAPFALRGVADVCVVERAIVRGLESEITCSGFITYVQPVDEQFSGAAVVRRSNSKRFPPTGAHPS